MNDPKTYESSPAGNEVMTSSSYYNENDPKTAAWLRALIAAELIPAGTVDERSICDVRPQDLYGFEQVHFFAGIAGWPFALHLAGWPEGVPIWTGSCPCQPFSAAGKGKGEKDSRHLWPEMRRLIDECGPAIVFGEQVASKAGRQWLNGIRLDLEGMGYAVGAADLCAAGAGTEAEGRIMRGDQISYEPILVGAPHIRQRLYWLAYAGHLITGSGHDRPGKPLSPKRSLAGADPATNRLAGGMVQSNGSGRKPGKSSAKATRHGGSSESASGPSGLEHTGGTGAIGPSPWEAFELASCRDGKARRIEPGTFPLAHGVPGRVAQLRGLGNAIVPQVAAEFIGAFLDLLEAPCK